LPDLLATAVALALDHEQGPALAVLVDEGPSLDAGVAVLRGGRLAVLYAAFAGAAELVGERLGPRLHRERPGVLGPATVGIKPVGADVAVAPSALAAGVVVGPTTDRAGSGFAEPDDAGRSGGAHLVTPELGAGERLYSQAAIGR